ncbi:bifunctional proline dehydrogenase/L-glutamate gamma-semialdehyde dehydrogenase [Glaciihabitans sp. GrIS 2.15]|uniref:bifunctional proline dehydrogenase/L-glutamate gamma-semialdehyde dehydrogenase n=1 Tax=Glaciihabitans sp. GrIS 2.15 TaxID=3071710 RepID=UPI002DFAFDA4|nr:RHH-type proline utilization regulon transcriptional repressor/proline dehydrogenase/delta 1-pyrroline-5-carboxylate dehydrogenase [Glaciihabitans sp. GrIS 2.15]
MLSTAADTPASPDALAAEAVATVHRWLAESAEVAPDRSEQRLAGVLKDPRGLDFTIGFVDRVVRPEDLRVAGRNLEKLSREIPAFLPGYMRVAIQLGGGFAPIIPWPIVPIARRVLRGMVSHLVLDASPRQLDHSLRTLRRSGIRLNLNLLGEAVLGDEEADRRLTGTRELLQRDDVDYVSIKVSSVSSQLSMWSFDETVKRVVRRLTPLYEFAAASRTTKFINLDMEEFRDLDLTIEVFRSILEQPKLKNLEAGIVLQAYLPDALRAMQGLTTWATQRRAKGGAGIKVRVVKGANLAMERVDATVHGWPLATWGLKRDTDANYKRILDWSLQPARTDAVRIGVAGHNLFDIAWAWLLAKQRRVDTRVEFEMLLGMASGQADAVRRDVGGLLLYTPVVHPGEFDAAISYLVRRLEENASSENFMSGVFDLASDPAIFDREAGRFLASLEGLTDAVPASHRVQDRRLPEPIAAVDTAPRAFANEPDTDPSIAANREWGRQILSRVATSTLGAAAVAAARITGLPALEAVITATARAGESWGQRRSDTRATVLHSAGEALAAARADLIEVMASETGKTLLEGDVEVSEAVDFAHYYAERARELDRIADAEFTPSRLIVVTPPWNFPVAIPAGSVLAALASGAGVIIKPAPQARRSAAVMVEALWAGGVPRDVLVFVDLDEGDLGRELVAHPSVDRVILTGAWETAKLFRSWRPDLPLLAETSGKNAIIVTPSADLDLAVADVVKSAFGHAGQKCSAASLVILVGSVAKSERFRRQLIDSVSTLRVGYPQEATTVMGPIIEPAQGKLRSALTTLAEGESWLVMPRSLDESERLWSPGVRDGVAAGSEFHLTEYFGPVLGIMQADTLEQAIALQNAPAYGLTAGIHSLDASEIALWVETVQAGNLYVNRGITGAVVRRQPFGGWKRSAVGAGAKAGGPNYLLGLGDWRPVFAEPGRTAVLKGLSEKVSRVIEAAQHGMEFLEFDRVRAAAKSDQQAWVDEYGTVKDVSGLGIERNVFRYRPVAVTVRLAEGASPAQLVRTIAAATRAGASLSISSAVPVAAGLIRLFGSAVPPLVIESVVVETDVRWHARLQSGEIRPGRIRLLGGDRLTLATVLGGDPDVAIFAGPVTTSGRIEMLPFLHEQAISITAHRFGNPDPSTFVAL